MMNNKVSFTNSNNPTISLSAVIYFPPKFDETRQYPAIVVSHPGGGVKEQTAGTYAEKLAEKGFVTIAYDASYQGESGGEPRQLENPYIRTEDVSAVIDYLTTLSYVDNSRIGAMGICAGAGYTANAAIQDRRIKAIGTVSAVNIGSMFRNGWENNVKSIDALPYVDAGSNARTSDISSGEYATMPLAPRSPMRRTKNCVRPGSITTPLARSIQQHRVTLLCAALTRLLPMMLTIWRKCT